MRKVIGFAVVLSLIVLSFVSCRKEHYELDNVNGVALNAEVLVPIAKASYSVEDIIRKLNMDSVLTFHEDGGISFRYSYENDSVFKGEDLLFFKDWDYEDQIALPNPIQIVLPEPVDTVMSFSDTILLESDYIEVHTAYIRSGQIMFDLDTNLPGLNGITILTQNIKDASGQPLELHWTPGQEAASVDLSGLLYESDVVNAIRLDYDLSFELYDLTIPEINIDFAIQIRDFTIREMRGRIKEYSTRNSIDTTFSLFPDNIMGAATVLNAKMRLYERNAFNMTASLVVDTARISGEGITPHDIFESLPIETYVIPSDQFVETSELYINGSVNTNYSSVYVSSLFTLNPDANPETITVYDTDHLDVQVDVDVPFDFNIEQVVYSDTVNLELSEIDMPDLIEQMILGFVFQTDLPLNLGFTAYMYDSEHERITDTLVADEALIRGAFDGQMQTTETEVTITRERVQNIMSSDKIILCFDVDTGSLDIALKLQQCLKVALRADVKYDGVMEFDNE